MFLEILPYFKFCIFRPIFIGLLDNKIFLLYFLLHQCQCANINEELYRQQRGSEITNLNLLKKLEDASSATKDLEIKYAVLIK